MSLTPTNVAGGGNASLTIAPWEHPVVWNYVGQGRYLQASFCKSAAQLYFAKFGCFTLKSLSNIAAKGGSIEFLEWSKDIGCCWDESVFRSGARGGSVVILEYLKKNGCPIPTGANLCTLAGAGGHLDALEFLRQSCGCLWDKHFCWVAASKGCLEILQYAYARHSQCPDCDSPGWDCHKVCTMAAEGGHIHILEWAHKSLQEIDVFDARTCAAAACGGKLDVLQYLRGLGCEWDGSTCREAISKGHVDVSKWALDEGCSWDVNERSSFRRTALHDAESEEVIEFLISRGADINAVDACEETPMHLAVERENVKAVVTFVRVGADLNVASRHGRTPLDIAIAYGLHEIVEVLRAAGARESHMHQFPLM